MAGKERTDALKQLGKVKSALEATGFDVSAAVVPGGPQTVTKAVTAESIDLLIMGYSHSPLCSVLLGE